MIGKPGLFSLSSAAIEKISSEQQDTSQQKPAGLPKLSGSSFTDVFDQALQSDQSAAPERLAATVLPGEQFMDTFTSPQSPQQLAQLQEMNMLMEALGGIQGTEIQGDDLAGLLSSVVGLTQGGNQQNYNNLLRTLTQKGMAGGVLSGQGINALNLPGPGAGLGMGIDSALYNKAVRAIRAVQETQAGDTAPALSDTQAGKMAPVAALLQSVLSGGEVSLEKVLSALRQAGVLTEQADRTTNEASSFAGQQAAAVTPKPALELPAPGSPGSPPYALSSPPPLMMPGIPGAQVQYDGPSQVTGSVVGPVVDSGIGSGIGPVAGSGVGSGIDSGMHSKQLGSVNKAINDTVYGKGRTLSDTLGELSARFESGGQVASIGYDRTGGTSYGIYQIASKPGTFDRFVNFLEDKAPALAKRLQDAGPANTGSQTGTLPTVWQAIAKESPREFASLQHDFIRATHFTPAAQTISKKTGLDIPALAHTRKGQVLAQVLWSTAVQHGPTGSARIFEKALQAVSRNTPDAQRTQTAQADFDASIVREVYEQRSKQFGSSSNQVQTAVRSRFADEMQTALSLLAGADSAA